MHTPHSLRSILLSLLAGALVSAGCGGDDADTTVTGRFADWLQVSGHFDDAEARCVAVRVIDRMGENEVRLVLDEPSDGEPSEELVAEVAAAIGACGIPAEP